MTTHTPRPAIQPTPARHPLALVIFDCDGVLIDSEPISLGCLTEGLNRIGVAIDGETVRARFAGTSMVSIMAHVAADYGIVALSLIHI